MVFQIQSNFLLYGHLRRRKAFFVVELRGFKGTGGGPRNRDADILRVPSDCRLRLWGKSQSYSILKPLAGHVT